MKPEEQKCPVVCCGEHPMQQPKQKRLIVCCDGTWQDLNDYPSNVVKIAQAIPEKDSKGIPQIVFYDPGIGTEDWWNVLPGGLFGIGIDKNIKEAYRFLCNNYGIGDEIYLFGFSRGAHTVRSLAGLIAKCGLLDSKHICKIQEAYNRYRENPSNGSKEVKDFRDNYCEKWEKGCLYNPQPITLLGCWDTVGSIGITNFINGLPIDEWLNKWLNLRFHDTNLSPIIGHALHAIAIDELQPPFNVTQMEVPDSQATPCLEEVWFPGDHGCVGGGTKETVGLSSRALLWMMDKISAVNLGLEFDKEIKKEIEQKIPNYINSKIDYQEFFDYALKVRIEFDCQKPICQKLKIHNPGHLSRRLPQKQDKDGKWICDGRQWRRTVPNYATLDSSVFQLWANSSYEPTNLQNHEKYLEQYREENPPQPEQSNSQQSDRQQSDAHSPASNWTHAAQDWLTSGLRYVAVAAGMIIILVGGLYLVNVHHLEIIQEALSQIKAIAMTNQSALSDILNHQTF